MDKLNSFINFTISKGDIPRVSDIIEYATREKLNLKRAEIVKCLRTNPIYVDNLHQEREKKRSRKQRPIISNSLGNLHADLGYFSVVREYETPKTFRHGFFIAKDILSRFVYVELLRGPKSAENLIKVLQKIFAKHKLAHPDYPIQSISFDKEPAMMSKLVQKFLKENNVKFYYFEFSSTKAKVAEGAIKLIRTEIQRMIKFDQRKRWWNILQTAADSLNKKEILIQNKKTGYRPIDLTKDTLKPFLEKVHKLVPGYYFGQFRLPPQLFKFKFEIGTIVRPKIIITSSQVIGNKTSQVNLSPQRFKIFSHEPFITADLNIRRGYKCLNLSTEELVFFSEEDLALSDGDFYK